MKLGMKLKNTVNVVKKYTWVQLHHFKTPCCKSEISMKRL